MLVPLIAHNGFAIVEVDMECSGRASLARQLHVNPLHIAIPPIYDAKAKPYHPLIAITTIIKITAIQAEIRKVPLVGVTQIAQRMHTVLFFGLAFPELKM